MTFFFYFCTREVVAIKSRKANADEKKKQAPSRVFNTREIAVLDHERNSTALDGGGSTYKLVKCI